MQEYFSLKSKTPLILNSKVVYKFACSRNVKVTYISMSARHLDIRSGEHLNDSRLGKSAIKDRIRKGSSCKTQPNNMKQFEIIRKCQTSYEAKIHETLVIKKRNPVLNKQLYADGASFLLNVFYSKIFFKSFHQTILHRTLTVALINSFETIICIISIRLTFSRQSFLLSGSLLAVTRQLRRPQNEA